MLTFTLSEVRHGTGWPRDAKFVLVYESDEPDSGVTRLREMAYERLPYRGAERVGELLDQLEILWTEWEGEL